MRYVFVKFFGLFWVTPNDPKDLKGTRSKISGREEDLKSLNRSFRSHSPLQNSYGSVGEGEECGKYPGA